MSKNGFITTEIAGVPVFVREEHVFFTETEKKLHNLYVQDAYDISRKVKIIMESRYSMTNGWNARDSAEYRQAILSAFTNSGWSIYIPENRALAVEIRKDNSAVYLHPAEVVGEISMEHLFEILSGLQHMPDGILKPKEVFVLENAYTFGEKENLLRFMREHRDCFYNLFARGLLRWKVHSVSAVIREAMKETGGFFTHTSVNSSMQFMAEEIMETFFQTLLDVGDVKEGLDCGVVRYTVASDDESILAFVAPS